MARINVAKEQVYTHEGAMAKSIPFEMQLRRSVMSCLLWEDQFYESGVEIAGRISSLVPRVSADVVARIAVEAREDMHLRHVPLLLVREMARYNTHKGRVEDTLFRVIQRADEISEFMAIYWKDGKEPIAASVKRGLARAFNKFDEYQFAKYNRNYSIKLRDVMFMVHPEPDTEEQAGIFERLANNNLATPDTWEVSLSATGEESKKEKWERLLRENKLGGMALLRNLRNMTREGVSPGMISQALHDMHTDRILPFRFIAAARHAPSYEPEIDAAMLRSMEGAEKFPGHTVILVDVSGSMIAPLSTRSDMMRIDAACGVAVVAREMCDGASIYTFSSKIVHVPPRRGMALRDAVVSSQSHGSTRLGHAVDTVNRKGLYDRIIVVTDEQSHDIVPAPRGRGYMINVASYKNGVGYGDWIHIDGWSEGAIRYIQALEHNRLV